MGCLIDSCEPLRIGVVVNVLFIVLAIVVVVLLYVARYPREQISQSVKAELTTQRSNGGYLLFLAAGCAFFGALQAEQLKNVDYIAYPVSWVLVLTVLLLTEFIVDKVSGQTKRPLWGPILGYITAILYLVWLWVGGTLPES